MVDTVQVNGTECRIQEEPDYRYGPQVRLNLDHKREAKVQAVDLTASKLKVYQHTPEWAVNALLEAGYELVYLHDESIQINSYQELVNTVKEFYNPE